MPIALAALTTESARDLTWRVDVPLAIMMSSVMEVFSRTSMTTKSLAFMSSSALIEQARKRSAIVGSRLITGFVDLTFAVAILRTLLVAFDLTSVLVSVVFADAFLTATFLIATFLAATFFVTTLLTDFTTALVERCTSAFTVVFGVALVVAFVVVFFALADFGTTFFAAVVFFAVAVFALLVATLFAAAFEVVCLLTFVALGLLVLAVDFVATLDLVVVKVTPSGFAAMASQGR